MSLQSDIQWIKDELSQVRDPELINAFKSLLKYRQKHQESNSLLNEALNKSITQADSQQVKPHNEIRQKYERWL